MNLDITRRSLVAAGLGVAFAGVPGSAVATAGFDTERSLSAQSWNRVRFNMDNTGNADSISLAEEPASSWSRSVDESSGSGLNRRLSPPVRSHRMLYYTTDSSIVARGSADGTRIWSHSKPESCTPAVTPATGEGLVVSGENSVTAWDVVSGDQQWDTELTARRVTTALTITDGRVYFGTTSGLSGSVIALDLQTGERLWRVPMPGAVKQSLAIDRGAIYAITTEGLVRRIESGDVMWEHQTDGEEYWPPIVADGTVIVPWFGLLSQNTGDPTGNLRFLDATDGSYINQNDDIIRFDFPSSYAAGGVFVTDSDGEVRRHDTQSDFENWAQRTDSITAAPVIIDDGLLVGTESGSVVSIGLEEASVQWEYDVLDEPISGICAGRNAIYVTGQFNAIGGLHHEPTVAARTSIQSLIKSISVATQNGINSGPAASQLATASQALSDGDYESAIEAAEAGQSELGDDLQLIKSTEETIRTTRDQARILGNQTTYDPQPVLATIEEAITALDTDNLQEANRLAEAAASELSTAEAGFENATTEIEAFNETIATARDNDIPLGNASGALRDSQRALQSAEFETAASQAARSRETLQRRINYIEAYRLHRETMTELIAQAATKEIQIDEGISISETATQRFEAGRYERAAVLMDEAQVQAETTIETAESAAKAIEQAESFDPMTPFMTPTARALGSETKLSAATEAYESGEYDTALTAAEECLSKQTQARAIVTGGLLSGVGTAAIVKRYDGLSKMADYLADRTADDELDEL